MGQHNGVATWVRCLGEVSSGMEGMSLLDTVHIPTCHLEDSAAPTPHDALTLQGRRGKAKAMEVHGDVQEWRSKEGDLRVWGDVLTYGCLT